MGALANLTFPVLRLLDPERAHGLALLALRSGLVGPGERTRSDPRLRLTWLGHSVASPIGLAAGFDKNATCVAALARLGFGALEVGTVTPLPQPGNPRPRMFRLPESAAVINRMGFNSDGLERVARRLGRAERPVPLGVNIGPNKASADPPQELARMVGALAGHVDWVTINVSSPNTPGLRTWQAPERLASLLRRICDQTPERPPLLVKLAPDLAHESLAEIVEACVEGGAAGLIVGNTTVARPPDLRGRHAAEIGGLSGRPLMGPSTVMLRHCARLAAGRLVLVGAGGVASGADVLAKLRAGASLVQLYTAFAVQGPALLPRLGRDVLRELARQGFPDVRSAIGADT